MLSFFFHSKLIGTPRTIFKVIIRVFFKYVAIQTPRRLSIFEIRSRRRGKLKRTMVFMIIEILSKRWWKQKLVKEYSMQCIVHVYIYMHIDLLYRRPTGLQALAVT